MWEYFTTKKHYDSGRLRHIGDIYTPYAPFKSQGLIIDGRPGLLQPMKV